MLCLLAVTCPHSYSGKLLPLVVDMFVEESETGVRVLVRALGGLVELERR